MRRVATLLGVTAAAFAAGGSGAWSAPTGPGPKVCGPAGSTTLVHTTTERVYSSARIVYGCLNPSGTPYKLGSATLCIGTTHAGPFALAGKDVAYGADTCGVDTSSTQVVVRSLSSGRTLRTAPVTSAPLVEQEGGLHSLVVKTDGAVAWIAIEQSLGNHERALQVFRDDRRGLKLLDSGLQVAPTSLKLHGSRLTWRHAGQLRSATLR